MHEGFSVTNCTNFTNVAGRMPDAGYRMVEEVEGSKVSRFQGSKVPRVARKAVTGASSNSAATVKGAAGKLDGSLPLAMATGASMIEEIRPCRTSLNQALSRVIQ